MRSLYRFYEGRVGAALLLLRLIIGLAFLVHGLQKVPNIAAFGAQMGLPGPLAALAAWAEVIGGALLMLGLLTPAAAILLAIQMAGTFVIFHIPKGNPFIDPRGPNYETAAVYLVSMLALLLTGPGAYSVDALLFGPRDQAERAAPSRERRVV